MIELLFESDGFSPIGQGPDNLTGLQVFHRGMFVQIIEGPEDQVWAAFETLGGSQNHVMRREIDARSLTSWNTRLVTEEILPRRVTSKLTEFAEFAKGASDSGTSEETTAEAEAIAMLTRTDTAGVKAQTIASGPFGAHLSGRSGNRAWVAV